MRKLLALLLMFALLCGCSAHKDPDISATPEPTPTATPEPTPTPPPEPITATLTVAGDIMLHHPQQSQTSYDPATGTYDYTDMVSATKPWLEKADYAIGNFETTFAGGPNYSGYPAFNSPDELGYALKDAGFDLMCTTNNHSLDRGFAGLVRTLDTMDQIGLAHVGTYRSQEERDANNGIVVADCGGISIAFLAYSYGTNGIPVPSGKNFSINLFNSDYLTSLCTPDTARIEADMAAARELGCDLIAVMMHWGVEYQTKQNAYQVQMAETMIDLGADLVLGGHAHVPQPYGFHTTKAGNTGFVCYSLGNYISNQYWDETYTTALLNLELKKDLVTGKTTVEGVNYVPFMMINVSRMNWKNPFIGLVDIYAGMKAYENGDYSVVYNQNIYNELKTSLSHCHRIFGTEGDFQMTAPAS